MASAAVQYPPLSSTVPGSYSSMTRLPPQTTSATPPRYNSLESVPIKSSRQRTSLPSSNPDPNSIAGSEQEPPNLNAVYAARSASSNHAKLHKRVGSKSSIPGRKNSASLERLDTSVGRQSPSVYVDASSEPPRNASSKSLPRDRLKALRKLTQSKDGDDQGIDLSLTAAENEERSGLGITTQSTHASTAVNELPYGGSPVASQNLSFSPVSPQSATAGGFRPTAPYAYPMRPTLRPSTPPTAQSYTTSMMSSDLTGDLCPPFRDPGRDIGSGSPEPFPDTASITSSTYRLPARIKTSDSLSRLESASQTNVSTLSGRSRPRRSTNRSVETTTTPPSLTPAERKHSFGLGRKGTIDPVQRVASISAAQQAFAEREELKARKYEKKEQKAAERRKRKREKEEAQKRRKSEPTIVTRPRRSSSTQEMRPVISGPEYSKMRSPPNGTVPQPRKTGRARPLKSGYLSFLSWMRVRMMRMGKQRSQSQ